MTLNKLDNFVLNCLKKFICSTKELSAIILNSRLMNWFYLSVARIFIPIWKSTLEKKIFRGKELFLKSIDLDNRCKNEIDYKHEKNAVFSVIVRLNKKWFYNKKTTRQRRG